MQKKDCFFLGIITKKYSFRGEVIIKLEGDYSNIYRNINSIYIESESSLTLYKINKIQKHKSFFLRVSLNEINDEKETKKILNKNVYLPLSLLPSLTGKSFYYHEVNGFLAIDNKGNEIGIIKSIKDFKKQSLFVIDHKETEILVPIHNDLIEFVNRKKKQIKINLPDGLIDIFKK